MKDITAPLVLSSVLLWSRRHCKVIRNWRLQKAFRIKNELSICPYPLILAQKASEQMQRCNYNAFISSTSISMRRLLSEVSSKQSEQALLVGRDMAPEGAHQQLDQQQQDNELLKCVIYQEPTAINSAYQQFKYTILPLHIVSAQQDKCTLNNSAFYNFYHQYLNQMPNLAQPGFGIVQGNNVLQNQTTSKLLFNKIKSKSITFMIIGYGYQSCKAFKIFIFSSQKTRQYLIRYYQMFRIYIHNPIKKKCIHDYRQLFEYKFNSEPHRVKFDLYSSEIHNEDSIYEELMMLRSKLEVYSIKLNYENTIEMCILKEFSKSLKKVYIKGPKLNIRGLQYILKDLPPSVSQVGLKFLYFDREIATTKYNIKKLKLEDMYNSQLPNILSLFTVTEKLKLNQSFLYDSNIVKYLNQIDTKEIVINVDIEKLPRIKNIFSALIRNNVFIRCSSSNYTKDIDWAFSHMKPKQLNKLWQISHVPYFDRNPSIIFHGAMGKCKRKQVNWTNSFSFDLENIEIQPDNVTQELNLYGENVITLAKLALKYCSRLRKLEICLAKKQIYIWKLIDIQTTWLEEINILNSSVNDHNFVDQLISKNQETLRCLRLNQCVGFDLSIIKHFKILTNLIIVNCQNLSNRETIATLTNLEALDTDDEVILQTARANNIIYRRGGFQKVIL